jgi:hypothetical protein
MDRKDIDVKTLANAQTNHGVAQPKEPIWNLEDFRLNQNVVGGPVLVSARGR